MPNRSHRPNGAEWTDIRVEVGPNSCDDGVVPLSEDEQRILRQIEHELSQDPNFSPRRYRAPRRRLILLVLGIIVGLGLTVIGLAVNFLVAFAGFVLVLVLAISLESEVRLIGRDRLSQLPISAWLGGGRRGSGDS